MNHLFKWTLRYYDKTIQSMTAKHFKTLTDAEIFKRENNINAYVTWDKVY